MVARPPEVVLVGAWHAALNAGDADQLVELTHDDVEVVGPRGSASGTALVRDWVGRAGIQLEPQRWFHREGEVVVEQRARWRAGETDEMSDPQVVATAFYIRDGRVQRVARYDSLPAALAAAGLDASTELPDHSAPGNRDGTAKRDDR